MARRYCARVSDLTPTLLIGIPAASAITFLRCKCDTPALQQASSRVFHSRSEIGESSSCSRECDDLDIAELEVVEDPLVVLCGLSLRPAEALAPVLPTVEKPDVAPPSVRDNRDPFWFSVGVEDPSTSHFFGAR